MQQADEAARRLDYTGAEPTAPVRSRIRHRVPTERRLAEGPQASSGGESSSGEVEQAAVVGANEEGRWAKYDSLWPAEVVEKLRASVWYPKGFVQSTLDTLEVRIDYRQAWVIGRRGCRCVLTHDKLFKQREAGGFADPYTNAVYATFDGCDTDALLRIFLPPDLRRRFVVGAEPLWNAHFSLTLGTIKVFPPGNSLTVAPLLQTQRPSPGNSSSCPVCLWRH